MVEALVAVGAVALVVLVVVAARLRRPPDTVASFRRQIDALSSEARRPVVDQVTQRDRDPAGATSDDDPGAARDDRDVADGGEGGDGDQRGS